MTQTSFRLAALTAFSTLLAAPALAAAPQPTKPVAVSFFSGQWHEIARTQNSMQKNCEAPTNRFVAAAKGGYSMVQTCRQGAPDGPAKTYSSKGQIVPGSNNAKFKMSFLGGLKTQEYWIVDRGDRMDWAVMATPGGNYVWLLSRSPDMSAGTRNAIVQRIKAMGFDTGRLVFPKQR
jgi:apolipoprotein D and lipocalin family protein